MTVRDWLPIFGALLVPIAIAAGTGVITLQQTEIEDQRAKAERELAEQRTQDTVVQAYLNQMNELMLSKNQNLLGSEQGDPVYTLAQARTATAITRLDASHNKRVMQFLMSSGLASKTSDGDQHDPRCGEQTPPEETSIHLLSGVDLRGVDLRGVDLTCANLSGAYLYDADLSGASLNAADLSGAFLNDASLSGAFLYGADLSGTSLYGADLSNTYLYQADLSNAVLSSYNDYLRKTQKGADKEALARFNNKRISHVSPKDAADLSEAFLYEANLTGSFVRGVDMSGADLRNAYRQMKDGSPLLLDNSELTQEASSLKSATMPNGQKYEEWLKDRKGRKEEAENE